MPACKFYSVNAIAMQLVGNIFVRKLKFEIKKERRNYRWLVKGTAVHVYDNFRLTLAEPASLHRYP